MNAATCFDYHGEPMAAYPFCGTLALVGQDDLGDWYVFDFKSHELIGHILSPAVPQQYDAGIELPGEDRYSPTFNHFKSAVAWVVAANAALHYDGGK